MEGTAKYWDWVWNDIDAKDSSLRAGRSSTECCNVDDIWEGRNEIEIERKHFSLERVICGNRRSLPGMTGFS